MPSSSVGDPRDTIFALSTGRLPSGVAIIRASGGRAREALQTLAGTADAPRTLEYSTFRGSEGEILDRGLSVYFPAPRSFTGEDCVEFHSHGGKAVVAALLRTLSAIPGLRHAEAGEFTRRAFLKGKLDLVQAEGLADLLAAETEAQRRFALQSAAGAQSSLYASWRTSLLSVRSRIEAELDFSDESDVPEIVAASLLVELNDLTVNIEDHLKGARASEIIRDGLDVVILGAPNAGKSTLINALAGRSVSIVFEEPGTTRDLIEISLDIEGYKVRLTDTAGLREAGNPVEAIGMECALQRAQACDLVLAVVDSTCPAMVELPENIRQLAIWNKIDQSPTPLRKAGLAVSAKTGAGLESLLREIGKVAAEFSDASCDGLPLRLRHAEHLSNAIVHLKTAPSVIDHLEIAAEHCRLAEREIGRITGEVDPEEILGYIFSQFCIGK